MHPSRNRHAEVRQSRRRDRGRRKERQGGEDGEIDCALTLLSELAVNLALPALASFFAASEHLATLVLLTTELVPLTV